MLIRIDARKLTNAAALHSTLDAVLGFSPSYGKNLDALVDVLTHLDDPVAAMSRVQVVPGHLALIVLEHTADLKPAVAAQVKTLVDVAAFVNWRRLEKRQPPVLALAYEDT
jgi:hypothetical protein